ncbi:MAG: hypothetical protein JNK79_19725 [Chitinophagaceae bacterium]|nr:hypothetical protein [Chitinophagaceae bacterium]
MRSDHYHFIVVGAGASGLSLLIHIINSGHFRDKKILLVDKSPKSENDRTWCFWEQEPGLYESIVFKKWDKLWFHGSDGYSALHDVHPYSYKMIRGIDFYNYCFSIIDTCENVSVEYGTAQNLRSSRESATLTINGRAIEADYIFSSTNPDVDILRDGEHFLWQHFRGWVVKTALQKFNPEEATLMDFRIDQQRDTRFVYVMPFSDSEALIEYTVFSKAKLNDLEYDSALSAYCRNFLELESDQYSVTASEFGMIPMTDINFPQSKGRIFFIGTAGGRTKASSGYTFRNIQKHSAAIVQALIDSGNPLTTEPSKKFRFYDSVLLKILSEDNAQGAAIFTKLFATNQMTAVFKFLDNETTVAEDIRLISGLPKTKFLKAAVSHLLK